MVRRNRETEPVQTEPKAHEDEVARLRQELEETNRGVVALYAELDEQAGRLRQAVS